MDSYYNELVRLLLADISALVPLVFPNNQPVSEANVRIMAVIMRRWLVDGDLQKVLSPLKRPAMFSVQGNTLAQSYVTKSGQFRYYLTAGIKMDGRPVAHIYDSKAPCSTLDRSFLFEGRALLTLKKLLTQPRLYHGGKWFNTAQILRFVANKLGGNHLDFDRSGEWALLDAANNFMRYGGPLLQGPPDGSELYLRLEPSSEEIIGGVHLEVIAAAASFVQMEIEGIEICKLQSGTSLIGRLRQLFRKRESIRLVERPSD